MTPASDSVEPAPLHHRQGALSAAELAEGAVLAALAVVLAFFGSFVPAGGVLIIAAITPYAALAYRNRLRAVFLAAAAGGGVLLLVLGLTGFLQQLVLAGFGYVIGSGFRADAGRARTAVLSLAVIWVPLSALAVAALTVFGQLRELMLEQIRIIGRTVARVLGWLGLGAFGEQALLFAEALTAYWWIVLPLTLLAVVVVVAQAAHGIAFPALDRIRIAFGPPRPAPPTREADTEACGPVPVRLESVTLRYSGADHDALADVDLEVRPGSFVVVCGDNGSGKSTLLRLLAGVTGPTRGRVLRPGAVGLGHVGGTAIVFQRPETQVLGVRVSEDLRWGLPEGEPVDVDTLLTQVGLAGMAERETSGLSGGELQRLAIAAALARRPVLLLSDESTAMLDVDGRREVLELLRSVAGDGRTVVHVTHHRSEAREADVVVTLHEGRVVEVTEP